MAIVQRYFLQETSDDDQDAGEVRPLADFFDRRVVVILGNPGIGKTTEFEHAADREKDAIYCTVSQFLADPIEHYRDKTVYLDALDEHRAETHQSQSLIDSIRGRLLELTEFTWFFGLAKRGMVVNRPLKNSALKNRQLLQNSEQR